MIVAEKGELLFVFNLHPSNSYQGYRVGTAWPGKYKVTPDPPRPSTNNPTSEVNVCIARQQFI